jgi:membrane-associated protease RseP (regulator of RpoE activity)
MVPYVAVLILVLLLHRQNSEGFALNPFTHFAPTSPAPIGGVKKSFLSLRQHHHSYTYHRQFCLLMDAAPKESDGLPSFNITAVSQAAVAEAQELRRRAQQLRDEARAIETSLETSKLSKVTRKTADVQDWMNKLFVNTRPLTAEAIARILREERFSEDQLVVLMEALYRLRNAASGGPVANARVKRKGDFLIADTNNAAPVVNQTESDLVSNYIQLLLEASAILDKDESNVNNRRWLGRVSTQLRSRLNEWTRADEQTIRRRLEAGIQAAAGMGNMTVTKYVRQTLGLTPTDPSNEKSVDTTISVERVGSVPMWVPSSLLSYVLASKTRIDAVDVRAIKELVLTKTRFFCTSSDFIPTAAVFRGNMRPGVPLDATQERTFSQSVFADIQQAMEREGLADRVQLFLLNDPEWRPNRDDRDTLPKPVILALPKEVTPDESQISQSLATRLVRISSSAFSLVTSLAYAIGCYALNPKIFDAIVNQRDISALVACVPVVGVLAIQATHELAHQIAAKRRGLKIGLPVLLPSFELGTFGCVTPLRSFPPNRSALLDFALSGPLVAALLSVLLMVIGCFQTIYASEATLMSFPAVPVSVLKSSFLSGSILTFLLPKAMMMPLSQPIPIHPMFMVGFSGILASALNLLPIFRLDGGRACSAAMGARIGGIASAWTLLSMLSLGLSGSGLAWTWGAFVLLFQRRPEVPVRDEVTAVDNVRIGAWVASLAVAVLALLPFPGGCDLL